MAENVEEAARAADAERALARTFAVGIPVVTLVAAIGVAGPTSRLSRGRIGEVSDAVVSMARRCADELIRQPMVEPVAQ